MLVLLGMVAEVLDLMETPASVALAVVLLQLATEVPEVMVVPPLEVL